MKRLAATRTAEGTTATLRRTTVFSTRLSTTARPALRRCSAMFLHGTGAAPFGMRRIHGTMILRLRAFRFELLTLMSGILTRTVAIARRFHLRTTLRFARTFRTRARWMIAMLAIAHLAALRLCALGGWVRTRRFFRATLRFSGRYGTTGRWAGRCSVLGDEQARAAGGQAQQQGEGSRF